MFSSQTDTSADNTSAVSLQVSPRCTKHTMTITTTGTVSAGTATVACDGATISGTIALTAAPLSYTFDGSFKSVVITPDSFSADCTFTVALRSK